MTRFSNKRSASTTDTVPGSFVKALIPKRYSESSPSVPAFSLTRLARLPRDASMTYGMSRVHASGRVAVRAIVQVLGWMHGDRFDIATSSGAVLIRPNPDGAFALPSKLYVILPVGIRRWCGISVGDKVLLVAAPEQSLLVIHTMTTLDTMIVTYHSQLNGVKDDT